jgi:hypothetical protein
MFSEIAVKKKHSAREDVLKTHYTSYWKRSYCLYQQTRVKVFILECDIDI